MQRLGERSHGLTKCVARLVQALWARNATRDENQDLIRLIESTTFRPRMVNGALADEAPVTVRYYLR